MADLIDFRGKLTRETYQVLAAISHATGRDMSELVREVLSGWAERRLHEAETVVRLARSEGTPNGGRSA